MKNIKSIVKNCKAILEDDFTELWLIVNEIQKQKPGLPFDEMIEYTKSVLDTLITNYGVRVIDHKTQMPIDIDKMEVLNDVEKRLKKLNRLPDIGEGPWFGIL